MHKTKPFASLSLDLDNQWAYMKTHGNDGWESFPSYLDIVVPRILNFLEERGLKITFFIVGQDAILEKNSKAIQSIGNAGHEIGNHSFKHEAWLHLYSEQQVESEISITEGLLEKLTGQKPIGFRGPGYSLSQSVLRVLYDRGYQYDASTLPTFIGPLARIYYFMTAKLTPDDKKNRKLLFGELHDGLRPIRPYKWQIEGSSKSLVEIPVTTMPVFRIPFHVSYLLYIYRVSPLLALNYFRLGMVMCHLTGTQPSLLLHPLDFLGANDIQELAFFPAMDLSYEKKKEFVSKVLKIYADNFTILPLGQFVSSISNKHLLQMIAPEFRSERISA